MPHPSGDKVHSLVDRGGLLVLGSTLGLFILPMVLLVEGTPPLEGLSHGFEIRMVLCCALISLALPLIQIVLQIRRFGGPAVRGNRSDFPIDDGVGGRVARAHRNMIESLVPFAIAVLSAQGLGVSNRWTVGAAALYVAARCVHALSYIFNIAVVRSAAFYAGVIATLVMIFQLPVFTFVG